MNKVLLLVCFLVVAFLHLLVINYNTKTDLLLIRRMISLSSTGNKDDRFLEKTALHRSNNRDYKLISLTSKFYESILQGSVEKPLSPTAAKPNVK